MPFPGGQKQLWRGRKGRTFLRFHLTQRSIGISEYWWLCENLGHICQFLPFLYAIVSILNFVPRDGKINRGFCIAASKNDSAGRESLGNNLWYCVQYEIKSPREFSISQGEQPSWGTGKVPGTCCSDIWSLPDQKLTSFATFVNMILPLDIVKDQNNNFYH